MKINRTVNFFWSGKFTNLQLAAILSYRNCGFTPVVWTIDDDLDLSSYGILVKDSRKILPFNSNKRYTDYPSGEDKNQFYHKILLYVDVFRMTLMQSSPHMFFSDVDMFCLQPPEVWDSKLQNVNCTLALSQHGLLNNAVLQFEDNNLLQQHDYTKYYNNDLIEWATYGPLIWEQFVKNNNLIVADEKLFYPYLMDKMHLPFSEDIKDINETRRLIKNSLAFHLWNNGTRDYEINENSFIGNTINGIIK